MERAAVADTFCVNILSQILLAYIGVSRYEGPEVNREMAQMDAQILYKAGEKKFGTDEKTFIQIFSERSRAQMNTINSCYRDLYGHSLKKVSFTGCSTLKYNLLENILVLT